MRKVIGFLVFVLALFVSGSPARAWNCTTPGQIRVQVPTGTLGAGTGDGSGQVVVDNGLTFECEAPPVAPPATTPGSNSNSTSSASSASNSASNSASSSTSNSGSNSSATGGRSNSTSTATGGQATGGSATVGISNAGNSTVTNNNSATGGAGGTATATGGNQRQSQSQSLNNAGNSTASASNNGNGNGNGANNSTYSNTTNVAASKIPVASAIAPPVVPTSPCFKGYGASAQTMGFGASLGGGKVDQNCAILETSRLAPNLLARCKVYITDKYAKAAGVTLDDCMQPAEEAAAPVIEAPEPLPAPVPSVVVNIPPQPAVVVPAPVVNVTVAAPAPPQPRPAAKKRAVPRSSRKCSPQPPCDSASRPVVWNEDMLEGLQDHNRL